MSFPPRSPAIDKLTLQFARATGTLVGILAMPLGENAAAVAQSVEASILAYDNFLMKKDGPFGRFPS